MMTTYWYGKNIHEMTRPELIKAIEACGDWMKTAEKHRMSYFHAFDVELAKRLDKQRKEA